MADTSSGDIENPSPDDPRTADDADAASPSSNAGNGSDNNGDPNKKYKVIALSLFLLAAVILSIALGVTLGQGDGTSTNNSNNNINPLDQGEDTGSGDVQDEGPATCLVGDIMYREGDSIGHIGYECINSTSYEGTESTCGPDGEINETEKIFTCSGSVPHCVQCGPRGRGAALCLSSSTTPDHCNDKGIAAISTTTTSSTSASAASSLSTPTPTSNPTQTSTSDDLTAPQVYKQEYLVSEGPILSQVRIINPGVADGYNSCDDMRDDIRNAVKHYANKLIVRESRDNGWYERCDPNNPNWWSHGVAEDEDGAFGTAMPVPAAPLAGQDESAQEMDTSTGSSEGGTASKAKEDSYETNNQVEGVDEADIVKSDGRYVYAAYGDLLYVWNATDGTKGVSITKMPQEEANEEDCPTFHDHEPKPDFDIDDFATKEPAPNEADDASGEAQSTSSSSTSSITTSGPVDGDRRHLRAGHRKTSMMIPRPDFCYRPKPRIESLLLEGSRLTAIVSEDNYYYYRPWHYEHAEETDDEKEPEPIISDYTKLSIRVYDLTNVPTDGTPLKILGVRDIKGNYNSARSINSTGFVITTSSVNTHLFGEDLYRYQPQYCGLNSTEYEKLAARTALKNMDPFIDRMLDELQLNLDGTCENMFQIAAMQSGESNEDSTYDGDMLSQFVQVLSFDMEDAANNFANQEITTNVAAAFSSGWLSHIYASQNFAATLNVGSSYNPTSGEWDQSTFILGFNISGTAPMPFCYAEVPGQPLNQYSTDLWDGHLRTVTTESRWGRWSGFSESRTTNKIFVLKVPEEGDGQVMERIGETGHIGKPNESVFAVRFIADKAYIVTYERIDPFYIFDLSDHAKPTKLGELEIPGFSSYLHPIEIDGVSLMLGIGEHTDEKTQRSIGVKISLFDISDPGNPTENATFVDEDAYSSANNDFKSFRFLRGSKTLIIPKSKYTNYDEDNFDGFVVYKVRLGSITPSYEIQHASSYNIRHGCWYNAYMPARSFVFQSKLTTILSHSVKSTDLENGYELWNMTLGEGMTKDCAPYFIEWD